MGRGTLEGLLCYLRPLRYNANKGFRGQLIPDGVSSLLKTRLLFITLNLFLSWTSKRAVGSEKEKVPEEESTSKVSNLGGGRRIIGA